MIIGSSLSSHDVELCSNGSRSVVLNLTSALRRGEINGGHRNPCGLISDYLGLHSHAGRQSADKGDVAAGRITAGDQQTTLAR